MGRKKKTYPPARMKQFTMRVTEEMYEDLITIPASIYDCT